MSSLIDRISEEAEQHEKAVQKLKSELQTVINDLPDNPRATRLSKQAFVMSSKDLAGGRWGVESHDAKTQYRAIIGLLDNVPLAQGIERIKDALRKGTIRMNSWTLHLHPDVIMHVSKLMDMDWSVYLLDCADGTLYCGATNNLQNRLETHNAGKGAKYTRGRLPVSLRVCRGLLTKSQALRLEHLVKKADKANKEVLLKTFRIDL